MVMRHVLFIGVGGRILRQLFVEPDFFRYFTPLIGPPNSSPHSTHLKSLRSFSFGHPDNEIVQNVSFDASRLS